MTKEVNHKTRTTRARSNNSHSRASRGSAGSSKSKSPPSHGLQHSKLPESCSPTASSHSPQKNPSHRYVSIQDRNGDYRIKKGGQINYGPAQDLNAQEQKAIQTHYGENKNFAKKRITQYDRQHKTYVEAAQATGRPLTEQEVVAKKTGANAPNASINHIIASGTGQNIMNHETLRFNQGKAQVEQSNSLPQSKRQRQIKSGLANQAAAVGRVQGYNRAIINERDGESLPETETGEAKSSNERSDGKQPTKIERTRNKALGHTLTAFQGKESESRKLAYKQVLSMTFDSPGNLRVGDKYGNNQASTGFDPPLNRDGKPTDRSERLLAAHQAYVPDRLEEKMFSVDSNENIISSSQAAPNPNKRKSDVSALPASANKKARKAPSSTPSRPKPLQAEPSKPPSRPKPSRSPRRRR